MAGCLSDADGQFAGGLNLITFADATAFHKPLFLFSFVNKI
jgi:hypothetical protein